MTDDRSPVPTPSSGGDAVLEVLGWVQGAPDPAEGSRLLLNGLQGHLGVSGGFVALRTADRARIVASRGLPGGWLSTWEAESRGDVRARLRARLDDEPLDAPSGMIDAVLKRSGIRALLAVPFGNAEEPDGVCVFASSADPAFPAAERAALETLVGAFGTWFRMHLLQGRGETLAEPRTGGDPAGDWGTIPVARIGSDGAVLEASRTFSQLLRFRPGTLVGRRAEQFLAVPDVPRFQAALDRARAEGAVSLTGVCPAAPAQPGEPRSTLEMVVARSGDGLLVFGFPSTVGVFVGSDSDLGDSLAHQPDLALVRIDRDGKIVTWPARATRILGWREEEVRGRLVELVFAAEDRPDWESRRRDRGVEQSGEWQVSLRTSDGDTVSCALRLLFLEESQETLFVIRDRRGSEASEKWLRWSRALLSVLGGSTLVLDPGGRIRELGRGWDPDGEKPLAEWLGRHVADLFDADRRDILTALRSVARDGDWTGSFRKAGRPVNLRLKAVRGATGSLEAIVGARLPSRDEDTRDLFRKIPVGMVLVDPGFRILEANPELAVLSGGGIPDDPVGLDVRSLAIFQTREIQSAIESLPESHRFRLGDVRLAGAGEPGAAVGLRGDTVADAAGTVTGYLITLSGPTGQSDVDRQMARAQKMESIGSLASGLAHDFGSFVSIILGKAGVLRVKLPDDPHIARELDDIETAAKRAQHLSQELMKFASGGRGRATRLQLNRLVTEVQALIRTSVGKKIDLDFRLDESLAEVEADEVEMQQLILNLCLNARDAMTEGGTLTIETRRPTASELARLPVEDAEDGVCLRIRDTGHGMPREVAERIFEPFFSTKEDHSGSGLGLAMVYGIVRRHRGAIDVQSAPGQGTMFEVVLPAATAGSAPPAGREILVVDDEPAFREMVRLILEEDGYRVRLAANGTEALQTLRAESAGLALVILDLRMPGVDGLAVLEELRELAPELPVLVATGYASEEEKARATEAGARRILQKPYRVADLRGALADLLGAPA